LINIDNIEFSKSPDDIFSPKQWQFIYESNATWNIAHGSVRSGKTECTLFRFFHAVDRCPDSNIYMVGHSSDTIYRNAIRLIFESPRMELFAPFCSWSNRKLYYKDKVITTLGAKDEGAIKQFQGNTWSLGYCDEMTLYPESIISMIDTRLSMPYSKGFATMNPSHPRHLIKQWIDEAEKGNEKYYSLHFTLDDNPFVPFDYKERIKNSSSGLFYKRNYLGLWCLAEGCIFDFFDRSIYVWDRPKRETDYYIAGVDFGMNNPTACLLIAVATGMSNQLGKCLYVEKEYYWNPKKTEKQKSVAEQADDIQQFLEPYGVRHIYIDPSAAALELELKRRGMHVINANNDVKYGISVMTNEMKIGNLYILRGCENLIKEIESYTWDHKESEKGYDEPVKKDDHAIDSLRYAIASHKVSTYDPYKHQQLANDYQSNRFTLKGRSF
jgi:PBSX family phage terminase large subunit